MKVRHFLALAMAALAAACAARPESIAPSYVSTLTYKDLSCEQLGQEEARVNAAYVTAAGQQNDARTTDTVGVVFLGLPVGSMTGENVAPQVANLKGQQDALHQVEIQKNCARSSPAPSPAQPAASH